MSLGWEPKPKPRDNSYGDPRIRITADHETEGFMFWSGEIFTALTDDPANEPGTEVKTAGEYVWLDRSTYEVLS